MRRLLNTAGVVLVLLAWHASVAHGQHIPSPSDDRFAGRLQCGPASMAIALRRLGVEVSDEELRELESADGFSTFEDLSRFANARGVRARTVRMDIEGLRGLRQTAILQVRYRRTPDTEPIDHFVVYAGYAADGSAALILDPEAAGGRGLVPMERLASRWTGMALVFGGEPPVLGRAALRTGFAIGAFAAVLALALMFARRSRSVSPAAVALLLLTAVVIPQARAQGPEDLPKSAAQGGRALKATTGSCSAEAWYRRTSSN